MEAIADALGRPVEELRATTSRPPAYGVRMGELAGGELRIPGLA
jgi:hypothetical protein